MLFVYAFQACSAVLPTSGSIAQIARFVVAPLLLLLVALPARFWHKLQAFQRGLAGGGWRAGGSCTSRGAPVYPRSLSMQVYYLTHRFAAHAQHWQFIICARRPLNPGTMPSFYSV